MMPYVPHCLWTMFGLCLLGAVVLFTSWFGVMEGIAIANGSGQQSRDTLSEVLWDHGRIPAVLLFLATFLLMGTEIWLLLHLISKGKWGL